MLPTKQRPQASVQITVNGLYRAIVRNGSGSAIAVGIRPGSAIAEALKDLRQDYPRTASAAIVVSACLSSDDVANWVHVSVDTLGQKVAK